MAERCFGCMQMKQMHPVCEHCGYDERTQNSDHQLPAGTVIGGQYLIGKALGQGGFGITYLAWDQVMNQPVAVKEYFPKGFASRTAGNTKVTSYDGQNAHDFEFNKKRFLREAESLAKLWNIPQIVKILRYFEENGTAYIVMEYVQGVDLRKHLKKLGRPLTVGETLALMGPVVEGLDLVHQINLVHRDISPDNIMVLPDGSTKLLDFGAARYVENANADQERLTSTQAVLKHGFAPPEQYRSHGALGPWTDVYALCATIYYCLSGKVPTEAMARTIDGEPIDWNVIHGLSEKQKAALEKGMTLQAKSRISSVQELWDQLKPAPKPLPERPKTVHKPRKKWILCATAVLAAAIALCLFAGVNSGKGTAPNVTYRFDENDTGWTIIGYEGELPENVVLPSKHEGKSVTSIAFNAFSGCSSLGQVTIPDSVTLIGGRAFYGCSSLHSVTIPNSVLSIGGYAFGECGDLKRVSVPEGCNLAENAFPAGCTVNYYMGMQPQETDSSATQPEPNIICKFEENNTGWTIIGYEGELPEAVVLPSKHEGKSVTSIAFNAFSGCSSLSQVTIPDSVTFIGGRAFYGCSSLHSVTIPDSVTSIGGYAFGECGNLKRVSVPDGCNLAENAFPAGCTVVDPEPNITCRFIENGTGWTIIGYEGELPEAVVLPSKHEGKPVTSIAFNAFSGCSSLSQVTIPDSVTFIGGRAFYGCSSLHSITIPDSLTSIGGCAFGDCSNLKRVAISKDCKLAENVFPAGCIVNYY